jgi:hypothetical protein
MFRTDLLSIIRSLDTVFTAIGICHTIYVDCLRADSQHKWYDNSQVLASAILLFIAVIKMLTEDLLTFERNSYTPMIICTPFLLKCGAAPLH